MALNTLSSYVTPNWTDQTVAQLLSQLYGALTPAITAHSGGGQSSATALTNYFNRVSTAGSGGTDSIALPVAVAGTGFYIINDSGNSIQVFAATPSTINGAATGTGVQQGTGTICFYYSSIAGNYEVQSNTLFNSGGTSSFAAINGTADPFPITGLLAPTATSAGGALTLSAGTGGATSGSGGAMTVQSGPAGATTGVAGALAITVPNSTVGAGSSITITAGSGAGGTAAGGNINLVPGAAVSTGIPGTLEINGATGLYTASFNDNSASSSATSIAFYTAPRACRVYGGYVSYITAAGGALTLNVTKDSTGTAPGGGTAVFTTAANLNTTTNTPIAMTPVATVATVTMAAGDRLSTKYSSTIQSTAGVQVTVLLAPC